MIGKKAGKIIGTSATSAWRGSAMTSVFAAGKGGQRWLAQALAKEFVPQGVHVACIIVDGLVDSPQMCERMPAMVDAQFLAPEAVADAAWFLANQHPGGWTFELDAHPHPEKW